MENKGQKNSVSVEHHNIKLQTCNLWLHFFGNKSNDPFIFSVRNEGPKQHYKLLLKRIYMYVCIHVSIHICVGTCRSQERASDFLELQLDSCDCPTWFLGIKLLSSRTAASVLLTAMPSLQAHKLYLKIRFILLVVQNVDSVESFHYIICIFFIIHF